MPRKYGNDKKMHYVHSNCSDKSKRTHNLEDVTCMTCLKVIRTILGKNITEGERALVEDKADLERVNKVINHIELDNTPVASLESLKRDEEIYMHFPPKDNRGEV